MQSVSFKDIHAAVNHPTLSDKLTLLKSVGIWVLQSAGLRFDSVRSYEPASDGMPVILLGEH